MLDYLPELLKGLHTSLTLTAASIVVALILSLIFTIILTLKTPVPFLLIAPPIPRSCFMAPFAPSRTASGNPAARWG
mgnify:CR=1 FL=1